MKTKLFWAAMMLPSLFGFGQEKLSYEAGLDSVLANNYDIRIMNTQVEQAKNNASLMNNDFLPSVTGSGNTQVSYLKGENKTVQGDRSFDPNESYNYGASLGLNYVVFNRQRWYNMKALKEQYALTDAEAKQVVEQSILQYSQAYFNYAQLQEQVAIQKSLLEVSKARKERAEYAYGYGQVSQIEVLNATVDFNNDSAGLTTQLTSLENARQSLNLLLGKDLASKVAVDTSVRFNLTASLTSLLDQQQEYNLKLQSAEKQMDLATWSKKANRATWLPTLQFNSAYVYNGSENPNGAFLTGNYSTGPQAGLSLSWSLFNGRQVTAYKNAKLSELQAEISKEKALAESRRDLMNAFGAYQSNRQLMEVQIANQKAAQLSFERSQDLYKSGQITSLDFRQAQLNKMNAELALTNAKYQAKMAELQVKQLAGRLVE